MHRLRPFVVGLLVFALVLVGVLGIAWAVGAQYSDAPETTETVSNESVTADFSNDTGVGPDFAISYFDNETITNSNGTTLTEGSDYTWNSSTGTISWINSSSVSDGESMTIDYAYTAKTSESRRFKTILGLLIESVLPVIVLLVAAMTIVALAGAMAAIGRGKSFNRR